MDGFDKLPQLIYFRIVIVCRDIFRWRKEMEILFAMCYKNGLKQ